MADQKLPSEMTQTECRIRAAYYRELAETATIASVRDALLRLAERFEALAREKNQPT